MKAERRANIVDERVDSLMPDDYKPANVQHLGR